MEPKPLSAVSDDMAFFKFVDQATAAAALQASVQEAGKTFTVIQHMSDGTSRIQACGEYKYEESYTVPNTLQVTLADRPRGLGGF